MPHALIIEDERLVASTMVALLGEMGLTTFSIAATQAEAIASAVARRPALLTVDIHLKQGNGVEAARRIRQLHSHVPVLYVTATPLAVTDDLEAVALAKPFTREALANAVAYLMSERPH
ncbi:Response regulator receiver domain-containing protein [Arboricoccus pini]|uniref:Response regulator receiver domain-containing protein n=1 Tax=Arboricoccus pini TaxID=1963835 RepID=A0A212R7E8_9PROT|nr:response regulator [Arboricoccus pini]SNB68094.1 Response regulator receiver domain-containing protein [Arboricoccus pini]